MTTSTPSLNSLLNTFLKKLKSIPPHSTNFKNINKRFTLNRFTTDVMKSMVQKACRRNNLQDCVNGILELVLPTIIKMNIYSIEIEQLQDYDELYQDFLSKRGVKSYSDSDTSSSSENQVCTTTTVSSHSHCATTKESLKKLKKSRAALKGVLTNILNRIRVIVCEDISIGHSHLMIDIHECLLKISQSATTATTSSNASHVYSRNYLLNCIESCCKIGIMLCDSTIVKCRYPSVLRATFYTCPKQDISNEYVPSELNYSKYSSNSSRNEDSESILTSLCHYIREQNDLCFYYLFRYLFECEESGGGGGGGGELSHRMTLLERRIREELKRTLKNDDKDDDENYMMTGSGSSNGSNGSSNSSSSNSGSRSNSNTKMNENVSSQQQLYEILFKYFRTVKVSIKKNKVGEFWIFLVHALLHYFGRGRNVQGDESSSSGMIDHCNDDDLNVQQDNGLNNTWNNNCSSQTEPSRQASTHTIQIIECFREYVKCNFQVHNDYLDIHTSKGRSNGKTKTDFINNGSVVANELSNDPLYLQYKKIYVKVNTQASKVRIKKKK